MSLKHCVTTSKIYFKIIVTETNIQYNILFLLNQNIFELTFF